ncbi:hypothetical protein Dimus_034189 [Dionaea muscipula]
MKVSYNNWQCMPQWRRYDCLKLSFNEGADEVIDSEDLIDWMNGKLKEIAQEAKARRALEHNAQGATHGLNSTPLQGISQTVGDPSKGVKRGRATVNRKVSMTEKKTKQLAKVHQNYHLQRDGVMDIRSALTQENANLQASQRSVTNSNTWINLDLNEPLLALED